MQKVNCYSIFPIKAYVIRVIAWDAARNREVVYPLTDGWFLDLDKAIVSMKHRKFTDTKRAFLLNEVSMCRGKVLDDVEPKLMLVRDKSEKISLVCSKENKG